MLSTEQYSSVCLYQSRFLTRFYVSSLESYLTSRASISRLIDLLQQRRKCGWCSLSMSEFLFCCSIADSRRTHYSPLRLSFLRMFLSYMENTMTSWLSGTPLSVFQLQLSASLMRSTLSQTWLSGVRQDVLDAATEVAPTI